MPPNSMPAPVMPIPLSYTSILCIVVCMSKIDCSNPTNSNCKFRPIIKLLPRSRNNKIFSPLPTTTNWWIHLLWPRPPCKQRCTPSTTFLFIYTLWVSAVPIGTSLKKTSLLSLKNKSNSGTTSPITNTTFYFKYCPLNFITAWNIKKTPSLPSVRVTNSTAEAPTKMCWA